MTRLRTRRFTPVRRHARTLPLTAFASARSAAARLDSSETVWKYAWVMCSRSSLAVERSGRVIAGILARCALACVASSCLPSSADLGAYSAEWSPNVDEPEQQMLPSQQLPDQMPADPNGAASESGQGNAANHDGAAASTAPPSSSELPVTAVAPAPTSQSGGGASTGEPAASETSPSSDPDPSRAAVSSVPSPSEQCADGVLDAAQASCYLVATVPATWQVARGDCTVWGGALVKVESPEEDQLVGQLVTQDLWLGASDTAIENVFVWTDGSPIVFGNWGPAQPDRFPGPDCVQKRSTAGRQWFDQPCDNNWLYVCEKPVLR
jgi:hypothetical protein